ncbi:MarR family transcriptional regulator [Shewanella basaltis]|uniref:MarR family transcriptional regulator n=1 Tax=Shewanella basaltis TaxID=472183 RepID=UPI003AB0DD3D
MIGIKGHTPAPDYPVDIWFDSLKSVTELAMLTGRAVSNVSRILKTSGKYNLVEMQSTQNMLRPTVTHQKFLVVNNEQ